MTNHRRSAVLSHLPVENCPANVFVKNLLSRCRKGESDPSIVIMNNADEVAPVLKSMAPLLPSELALAQLSAAERSMPDVSFRYAVVYKDGRPLLFSTFQVYTITARNFNLHRERTFVKHILGLFLDLRRIKVVVSGNALRTDMPCFCYDHSELPAGQALELVASIADTIADRDEASAVILTGTGNAGAATQRKLATLGYQMPWEDMAMEMSIPSSWECMSQYIGVLSRKYRARAQKIIAAGSTLRQAPITDEELVRLQPDIDRLFAEVIENQPFVFTTSGSRYIAELKRLYKDNFEIIGFFEGDVLVAFYSAFVTLTGYELFYVGYSQSLNAKYQLYFNMLFSGLGRAIALRKQQLLLGRTSFDAKASLGAKAVRKDYLIRLFRVPEAATRWFVSYFSSMESGKWTQRNPLKEDVA